MVTRRKVGTKKGGLLDLACSRGAGRKGSQGWNSRKKMSLWKKESKEDKYLP